MLDHSFLTLFNGDRLQINTEVLFVEGFSEIVAIVNDAVSSKDVDLGPNVKIVRRVELLFGHVHAWVAGVNRLFGKFLFLQQERERVLA